MSPVSVGRAFRHAFEGAFWRRVMIGGLRIIPLWLQNWTMPFWAGLFYLLLPKARGAIKRNLEILQASSLAATPPATQVIKARPFALFVNYAQAVATVYNAHLGRRLTLEATFHRAEILHALVGKKQGVIAMTGHLGYWQITPFFMAAHTWLPRLTMAMAEEPNPGTAQFEAQFRKHLNIVYTTRSPFAMIELANILRRGEFVGMQLDRPSGGATVSLPFAGKPAAFPLGPATLARATGCPLLPVFVVGEVDRRRGKVLIEDPIFVAHTADRERDLYEGTAKLAAIYERIVCAYPEQWFNFYDFWTPSPSTNMTLAANPKSAGNANDKPLELAG